MTRKQHRVNSYIMRFAVTLLATICCTAYALGDHRVPGSSRAAFGQSGFDLWSPLTPFEQETLQRIARAQSGDPNALLALYFLAAGSHRDKASYLAIQLRIDTWLSEQKKSLQRKRKLADKAKLLHDAMHREFFLRDDKGDTMIGYDADQSQLPEIFNSQTFNCISSSLLYLVLARKLDLPVSGVLLPSHAFVQLREKNNTAIDIETTSIYGFGVKHDPAFYQHEDLSWFEQRNLEPTTYQDYLQRQVVSAYQLGLHGMWSQHTSPERMDYFDRMRLAEIRGYLQPDDIDAQKNRLNFYSRELNHLNRQQKTTSALRLSQLIEPYVNSFAAYIETDKTLRILWFNIQTERALAQIQAGNLDDGLNLAKALLARLEEKAISEQDFYDDLNVVLAHYWIQGSRRADYDYAQLRLSFIGLEQYCINSVVCRQGLTQFYSLWGQQFWQQQDWQTVSRILTEYNQFGIDDKNSALMRNNAESAYLNLAKEYLLDEDWESALTHLQQCAEQLSGEQRCSQQIRYIKEQRHLGNI